MKNIFQKSNITNSGANALLDFAKGKIFTPAMPSHTSHLHTEISKPNATMMPHLSFTNRLLRIFARSLAILTLVLTAQASLIYTDFSIASGSSNVGTFSIAESTLYQLSHLSQSGGSVRNYAYRVFTPSATGNYTLGMTDANYDPVMILYSGLISFPANPATGAIGFNDDGDWSQFSGRTPTPGDYESYMPLLLDQPMTAGTNYLVAISTYSPGQTVQLPASFFLAGPGAAGLDGAPAAPPAPTSAIWTTGSGNWTTSSQWDANTPPVNGVAVEFSGSGGTSTNDFASGNLSAISGLTFTSNATGSYTIDGNGLAIGAGGIVNNSTSTQTVAIGVTLNASQTFAANTANLVVSGNISGNASLTKTGNQTLTLSGSNTYSGETLVEAGTLAIASSGSLTGTSKTLVGNFTSGNTMSVLGSVSTGNLTLSEHGGSNDNTLIVGGGSNAASLTVGNLINVGFGGEGNSLEILGNGTVTAASTWVGGYGSNNTLEVTGGRLNNTSSLVVGYFSDFNTANITSGGNATVGSVTVGLDASSSNNTILVSGSGSALNTAGLIYLGENGTSNSLVVENGGKVHSQNQNVALGVNAGSNNNALTINGTGSHFSNNNTLYVGNAGSANSLTVSNGGNLTTANSRIGAELTSANNTAIVSGAGSIWTNTGTLRVGSNGTANSLAIANGGQMNSVGDMFLGYDAGSTNNLISVNGTGSKLVSANLTVGYGGSSNNLLVQNGGNLTLTQGLGIGYDAASANNIATVTGAGSTLNAQNIQIGNGADNKLIVADSATVSAANIALAGTNATLQIGTGTAAGNLSLSGGILAFSNATGQAVVLNHTDSAYQFTSGMSGDLAVSQIGTGTTILTANNTYTGTTTVNNGTLQVASGGSINNTSDIFVGLLNGDNGTFNLNGGIVSNAVGYLGSQDGSVGAATVSAGNWTNTGSLFVGLGGIGSLTINGTGHVTNEDGFVGHFSGSTGTVGVSGGTWTNNINLFIGNEGTGSLTISGTANVTSIFGYVGNAASGNGTVSVSGGTWTNSSNLDVGGAEGTGSLTINGTGTVIVGGTLSRGSNGTINLESAGTLQIGTGGATGTLSTDLANNGNLIFNLTGSSEDTHAISGTGTLTKNGTGTLILSGSNTYTGSTTLNAGTLEVNSSLVNTATTVNSGGTLAGVGSLGDVTINSGGAIAPGNSPGTITVGNMTLYGGAIYNWQTISSNGTGAAGTDWDVINSIGSLSIGANSTNQITIYLSNLDGPTLEGVKKASWEIGNFTTGINQFSKNAFSFNATNMTGNDGRYFMSLGSGNTTLVLNYKTAATWNTGSGNWTTPEQWEDESLPENGDAVEFTGSGGISTNNFASGNLSYISGISFLEGAGAYTVNGSTLQIKEDGIINSSNQTQTIAMDLTSDGLLTVNADSGNITLTGVFSGNFQSNLDKNGNHTLTLTGNNTYEGGTIISAGTLALGGTAGAVTGNISVNSGATFAVNRTNNTTISNLITGAGSFAQVGTSATKMTAVNTYSGGTTISSGTLWTKNSQALGMGNVLVNGGTLLVTSSQESIMGNQTLSIGGNLDWTSGKIAFYDTGTSPLSGNLTINVGGDFTASAGNKTFDFSGVEALNSGNYTLVTTVGLVNISDVNFVAAHGPYTTLFGNFTTTNNTVVYTVTGATSGGANIENNGGPNTPIIANYNITAPTITVGVDNRVNALTFTGSNSLAIQSNGQLTVTSGTLAVQTGSSVVSGGTLNTPGNLDKTGTGELDLDNTTNVNGIANVVAGLLSVNGQLNANSVMVDPTATLGGAGVIVAQNVVVNGNLSPGNSPGTLNVVGNLVLGAGSSTVIEIASPTNFDRIVVSGTATLGGTLNAVAYGGGTITPGARYDFLQAGSIDGEFASLIAPDGLRIRFLNSGTVGSLLFGPASFVPYALNQNQINVAKALDIFVLATEGDAIVVGTALDSLTTEQFPAAFDQIMPGFYESLANMAIEQAFNQTQMLNQRISSVRLGAQGFQAMGISQPIKYDKDGTSAADAKTASPIVESAMATNWNSWVMANGEFSISRGLAGVPNYNNNAGGFLVGADYRLSENFSAGVFAGYEYSYAKYDGGSSTRGNSALFGLYGSYTNENGYYADAIVSGGYTGFQTRRSIEFGTIDRTASADPNSGQFSAALNLGKDFEIGKFTLGPIIGAQYTYAGIGGFTETGADSLDLALGQQNANSLRSNLGARFAYNWEVGSNITLIPEVRAFWMHEFLNNSRNISSALDGGNGASFDYETEAPYRNSIFGGVGVSARFGDRWNASVFYNVNFGSENYSNNIISTSLGFSF